MYPWSLRALLVRMLFDVVAIDAVLGTDAALGKIASHVVHVLHTLANWNCLPLHFSSIQLQS